MIVTIDVEALRRDMLSDSMGAFYGGGFGGAMFESFEIERATPQELADMAVRKGIDLRPYIIDEEEEEEQAPGWDPYSW